MSQGYYCLPKSLIPQDRGGEGGEGGIPLLASELSLARYLHGRNSIHEDAR